MVDRGSIQIRFIVDPKLIQSRSRVDWGLFQGRFKVDLDGIRSIRGRLTTGHGPIQGRSRVDWRSIQGRLKVDAIMCVFLCVCVWVCWNVWPCASLQLRYSHKDELRVIESWSLTFTEIVYPICCTPGVLSAAWRGGFSLYANLKIPTFSFFFSGN